eukprot:1282882-Prymnesium_polylepis.1
MATTMVCKRSINVLKGFKTCAEVVVEPEPAMPLSLVVLALTLSLLVAAAVIMTKRKRASSEKAKLVARLEAAERRAADAEQ